MKKNSFVQGTIIATVSIILVKILGALYVIPFYNIIGEKGGTLYSYAYNIYNFFLAISITGFPIAISKMISEYNEQGLMKAKEKAYKVSKWLIGILAIFTFLVVFIFAKEIAYLFIGTLTGGNSISEIAFVIRVISFSLLIIPFLSITRGYLQGHQFISPSTNSQILEQVVRIFIVLVASFLAIKVFKQDIKTGVAWALSGSFFGGLCAYIYLKIKMQKNQKAFLGQKEENVSVETKKIVKKFIGYAIPSIIVAVITSIYDITDQILILRGSTMLGFTTFDSEIIASIISTWGAKICMIITAIGMGISMNTIPHMVSAYVHKDYSLMNKRLNQILATGFFISIPLAVGLCFFSEPIYRLFYGVSDYGPMILKVSVFVVVIGNINSILNTCFISINQHKLIYLNTFLSVFLNLLLDLPLMFLFHKIGLFAVWGASVSTIISTLLAVILSLAILKRIYHFKYDSIFKTLFKLILPLCSMILCLIICNYFYDFTIHSNGLNFIVMLLIALGSGALFLFLSYKNGLLNETIGEDYLKTLIHKISFKKKVGN